MSNENNIFKKLVEVMKQVRFIEKKGWNSFNKYKYATESDVQEKVREVLAEQNVIMFPNVLEHTSREHINRKGNTEYISTVKVQFTFVDADTGQEYSVNCFGEGQDTGDKAVYKAITGAQKYALMKTFMIPTGDDPERDNSTPNNQNNNQPKKASDKQLDMVNSLLKKKVSNDYTFEKLHQGIKNKIGTNENIENWTSQQASQAIKILSDKK